MNLADEFVRTLRDTAERLGVQLDDDLDATRSYAEEQMRLLSVAADEPGYHAALVAAGINVTLAAAGGMVDAADAVDESWRELMGTVTGMLGMAARALLV